MDSTMTDNRGPLIVPVIIMFFVLTSIFIPLRVYTRLRIIKAFALDDWLAVITQVSTLLALTGYSEERRLTDHRFSSLFCASWGSSASTGESATTCSISNRMKE